MIKEEKTYLELKQKADAILASGKEIEKMSNKDLSIILKSLKRNGDKRLPTKKQEMIVFYKKWKTREPLVFEYDAAPVDDNDESDPENEYEDADNFVMI